MVKQIMMMPRLLVMGLMGIRFLRAHTDAVTANKLHAPQDMTGPPPDQGLCIYGAIK